MNHVQTYFEELQQTLNRIDQKPVEQAIELLQQARLDGRQVFVFGNGGSASTASHMVCDLAKNTRAMHMPPFKVIGLADNMAIFSAYGNDEGYENVFAQQLASLVQAGDIVVGISTSGNSPNVLQAIELARTRRAVTIAFTGFDSGKLGSLVDLNLHVPSDCIEQVEDIHLILEHLITKVVRETAVSALT